MASDQLVVAPMVARRVPLPDSSVADFGGMLRVLRHRARLTQRELGLAVGYSEAQISRLEKGKRLPDPSVVAALFLPSLGPGKRARTRVPVAPAGRDGPDFEPYDGRADGRRAP
jgi:DNA-binding XRE family transcriptional regulator